MEKVYIVIETYEGDFNKIDRVFEDLSEARQRQDLLSKIQDNSDIEYEIWYEDFVPKTKESKAPNQ